MSEQSKIDADQFGDAVDAAIRAASEMGHAVSVPVASAMLGAARASLPVGVPDGCVPVSVELLQHIRANGNKEIRPTISALLAAAPTVKAEQVDMADAYVGAREDLAIWKRRALEAEQKVRHQEQIIDHLTLEAQGETRFGEPSMPAAEPVAVIEYTGYDPANSIKWLNKGLQYMEPGTLLYAQAPPLPAAGSAVEEVEVVAWRYRHSEQEKWQAGVERKSLWETEPLMTVAQHNRIDGQRLAEIAQLRTQVTVLDLKLRATPGGTSYKALAAERDQLQAALSAQQSAPERVSVPVELLERIRDFGDAEIAVFRDDNNGPGEWVCPACDGYSNGTWRDGKLQPFPGIAHADDCWLEELRALLASHGRGEA